MPKQFNPQKTTVEKWLIDGEAFTSEREAADFWLANQLASLTPGTTSERDTFRRAVALALGNKLLDAPFILQQYLDTITK